MTTTEAAEPILLDALAARNVPRYTSYPTAPHLSDRVDHARAARWLELARGLGQPVSVYLHIPFCRSMCHYCGCNTKATRRDAPVRAYADTLAREIELAGAFAGGLPASHVHWGGGTPNLLPPELMESLLERLGRHFPLAAKAEHAIELDPRHVDRRGARMLTRLGITRASLGVQDLDPAVQAAIGRLQPRNMVERATADLREVGIEALNFDLIYGLPLQTVETVTRTAESVAALAPSRIALFGYAHVPWMKPHQRLIDEALLPGTADRLAMARAARGVLRQAGYAEIGIDHFALPGDELARAAAGRSLRRNFQGYTTDRAETLIGLGASAIGATPFGLVQNATDVAGWSRAVEAGRLPVVRGHAFAPDDLLRGQLIEELLCGFETDVDRVAAEHGLDAEPLHRDLAALAPYEAGGWVKISGGRVSIPRHGAELARLVAATFDAYLGRGGRHSAAI